jgi:hypothetical protein
LHKSNGQLEKWKLQIDEFLKEKLKIELHPDKSNIISLSKGIDFVGFRNFYYFRLLRRRNIRKIRNNINMYNEGLIDCNKIFEIMQGWQAYACWGNTYRLREMILRELEKPNLYINV